ncbi:MULTISPECIES: hypothetical protein [unclassified Caballeronia]|uniref:hypothetical protein n=1 Tax=unclassified Caballeronia TaxID=2646786 RepID=UPI00285B9598|nr:MULTISPECIES: hypothetical protein [unclassified Caballeronia]MDR5774925.1 hypothetical protein [Caballeronia sp. LZ002]MDR5801217.1 hypothetical protein [Caballeronia sp. LZ001]MDR5850361.1 hypothetical protein [Caballeronia sp. LZ003]
MTELTEPVASHDGVHIEQAYFLRAKHLPWVCVILLFGALCTGVAGVFAGSTMQASKNEQNLSDLNDKLAAQKLEYEQRLGKQSAQYAIDVNNFADAIAKFGEALDKMDAKNDRRAAERERAQAAAIAAAQKAAVAAAVTAQKTEQILVKTDAVQQQATEAASAAKATEKKLDTATHPTAAVPPTPWAGNRR